MLAINGEGASMATQRNFTQIGPAATFRRARSDVTALAERRDSKQQGDRSTRVVLSCSPPMVWKKRDHHSTNSVGSKQSREAELRQRFSQFMASRSKGPRERVPPYDWNLAHSHGLVADTGTKRLNLECERRLARARKGTVERRSRNAESVGQREATEQARFAEEVSRRGGKQRFAEVAGEYDRTMRLLVWYKRARSLPNLFGKPPLRKEDLWEVASV